jgi:hypothetical protein
MAGVVMDVGAVPGWMKEERRTSCTLMSVYLTHVVSKSSPEAWGQGRGGVSSGVVEVSASLQEETGPATTHAKPYQATKIQAASGKGMGVLQGMGIY